jgi:hypothetical protein
MTALVAGIGAIAFAVVGFILAAIRAGGKADELTERALRQERAVQAGVAPHTGNVTSSTSSPPAPPGGADAPRALDISSPARGATTSRRKGRT